MKSLQTAAVIVLNMWFSLAVHALEPAGKVVYAFGDVAAVDEQGGQRRLERSGAVYGGETIRTREGRAHVKFTDNGFVALNPNTSYRIDDFSYQGRPDGTEKGFFSLIRGSVRIVTGIIGHRNKANFKLVTPVATIGIRGTSGLIQHCAGDCAGKEDGTYVAGYGGSWDLKSGQFEGSVDAGDSYHCTGAGAGCSELEAAPEQREDVSISLIGEDERDDAPMEPAAAAGLQVGSNGRLCDFGGGCGQASSTNVLLSYIGPDEQFGVDGATREGVLVSDGDRPIAFVALSRFFPVPSHLDFEALDIDTVDVTALESALTSFSDPYLRQRAQYVLALAKQTAPSLFESLLAAPATIASTDFGLTSDGVLRKGRYTDGFLLEVGSFSFTNPSTGALLDEDDVSVSLHSHTGFQSTHFIFGNDPGPIQFFGQATYTFTGGTLSTSETGASIGSGVTSGTLGWVFGLDVGQLDMNVQHGGSNFRVLANLVADTVDRRVFSDYFAAAFTGSNTFFSSVEGFFAGAGAPGRPPQAAGLHYVIGTPDPILGVAGFGLAAASALAFSSPAAPVGTVVAWSHSFVDTGDFFGFGPGTLVGTPVHAVIEQASNRAVLGSESIVTATSTFSEPYCSLSACVFNGTTGTRVESGSTSAALGVSWARFTGNYIAFNPANVDPSGNATNRGDFHLISSTAPATSLPSSGQIVYSTVVGGTAPTLNTGATGEVTQTGALSAVSVTIDYGVGDITDVQVAGAFSSASFALASSAPAPISNGVVAGNGLLFTSTGTCSIGCGMGASFNVVPVGAGGSGVMGSYGAGSGFVSPSEQFSVNGTFVVTP